MMWNVTSCSNGQTCLTKNSIAMHIGAVGEAADKENAARFGRRGSGTKAVQVYSVGESDRRASCHHARDPFRSW